MHWPELNYYESYNYLPIWTGFVIEVVGALIGLITQILTVSSIIGVVKLTMSPYVVFIAGSSIAIVLMFVGMFMEDTSFLIDSTWREEMEIIPDE